MGQGLLGKKVGEVAEILTPTGKTMKFEIQDIQPFVSCYFFTIN